MADLVISAREWVRSGKGRPFMEGTLLADGSLAEDVAAQEKWLTAEAKMRGYADIEDLLTKNYPLFEKLAKLWREKNPADALLSRYFMPLVTGRADLEKAIALGIKNLQSSIASGPSARPVMVGRTPHVLSMLGDSVAGVTEPLALWMDAVVRDKVFFGKHSESMSVVTPEMLVRALYRPAAIIKDSADPASVMLVTNILTERGPVVVDVKTANDINGSRAAIVRSAYPREEGRVADWINGKDFTRQVVYIDPLQIGEAVTGNLNPENVNATRSGWRVVPAPGEINGFRSDTLAPTSHSSDKLNEARFGPPRNEHYRGLKTVEAKLQQRISGRGMPKVKTYDDLLA